MDQATPGNRNPATNSDSVSSGSGSATGVAAATERKVDEYASRAHRTIDRAASSAQPAVDKLAANAHDVVERVATKASDAAEGLDSRLEDLQSTRERLSDQCRSYVEDNPLKAVGIALAAGFILSRLI